MALPELHQATRLLPLLLSLPAGTVAGLPGGSGVSPPMIEQDLACFGPRLRSEADLRHAALRPPTRAVVEIAPHATVVSETALSAIANAGAVVVLRSCDVGLLARLCHRILTPGGSGLLWVAAEAVHSRRCLLLRLAAPKSEQWLRVPLESDGAEGVLAHCRALGIVVCESRVEYGLAAVR